MHVQEVALGEVLGSTNLQPELIGNAKQTLQQVLEAKNQIIAQLSDQLQSEQRVQ